MVEDLNKAFKLTIPNSLYGRLDSVEAFAKEILILESGKKVEVAPKGK